LANDIKIYTIDQYCSTVNKELQGTHSGDLHPLRGKSGLDTLRMIYSDKRLFW